MSDNKTLDGMHAVVKSAAPLNQVPGAVIGVLERFDESGEPEVLLLDGISSTPVAALSTVLLDAGMIGLNVLVLVDQHLLNRPIIIGQIQSPKPVQDVRQKSGSTSQSPQLPVECTDEVTESLDHRDSPSKVHVQVDDEQVLIHAQKEIVLRCGKASITLTRAGKVIIRGEYVSSRSRGVNRIRGGSIQLN